MQARGRKLQPVRPAQGASVHEAAGKVGGVAQGFQQRALAGAQVYGAIENALGVVGEGQFKLVGSWGMNVKQLNHGRLLGCGRAVQSAGLCANCS